MAEGYGHELLHACIEARLTPLQRSAFIDHRIMGRTLEQIATEYGVTSSAVRELSDKARRKLAAVYRAELAA